VAVDKSFFDEQREASEVKSRIIEKYFFAWANIIRKFARDGRINYIDLYAGPGRYKDDTVSTPLLVLKKAIQDENLSQMLVALLNDGNKNNSDTLQKEIDKLDGIEKLKHKPTVLCGPVDGDAEKYFTESRLVPSFTFFDPFGYKGLSLRIINGVIKDWGCDCVFFFNYNRINPGISNDAVEAHMDALFGTDRAKQLRSDLKGRDPGMRENIILENMAGALRDMGGEFVLPFQFRKKSRTSHYLFFVSKDFKGYEVMKEIMAKESSTSDEGVPSFAYSPADQSTPFLFSFNQPIANLRKQIRTQFSGEDISMWDIYRQHSVNTPYIKRNYKQVLYDLYDEDKIEVSRKPTRKGTFADDIVVNFPEYHPKGKK
jgi:three-Cys-motif partner protein